MEKNPYKKFIIKRIRRRRNNSVDNDLSGEEENWMNSFDEEMRTPLPVNLAGLTRFQLLRYLKMTIMSAEERQQIITNFNITEEELLINFRVPDCNPTGIANFDPELLEYLNIDIESSDESYESSSEENNITNESKTEKGQPSTFTEYKDLNGSNIENEKPNENNEIERTNQVDIEKDRPSSKENNENTQEATKKELPSSQSTGKEIKYANEDDMEKDKPPCSTTNGLEDNENIYETDDKENLSSSYEFTDKEIEITNEVDIQINKPLFSSYANICSENELETNENTREAKEKNEKPSTSYESTENKVENINEVCNDKEEPFFSYISQELENDENTHESDNETDAKYTESNESSSEKFKYSTESDSAVDEYFSTELSFDEYEDISDTTKESKTASSYESISDEHETEENIIKSESDQGKENISTTSYTSSSEVDETTNKSQSGKDKTTVPSTDSTKEDKLSDICIQIPKLFDLCRIILEAKEIIESKSVITSHSIDSTKEDELSKTCIKIPKLSDLCRIVLEAKEIIESKSVTTSPLTGSIKEDKLSETCIQIPKLSDLCRIVLEAKEIIESESTSKNKTFKSIFQVDIPPGESNKSDISSNDSSEDDRFTIPDEEVACIIYDEKKCRIKKVPRKGYIRPTGDNKKKAVKPVKVPSVDSSNEEKKAESDLIEEIKRDIKIIRSMLRKSTNRKIDPKLYSSESSTSISSYDESIGLDTIPSGEDKKKSKQRKRVSVLRKKNKPKNEYTTSSTGSTDSDITNEDNYNINQPLKPSASFCSLVKSLRRLESSEKSIRSDKSPKLLHSGGENSKSSKEPYSSSLGSNFQYSDDSNARIPDDEIILSPPLSFSENTIITISSENTEDEHDATHNSSYVSVKEEVLSLKSISTSPASCSSTGNKTEYITIPDKMQEFKNVEDISTLKHYLSFETFPDTSGSNISTSSLSTESFTNLIFTEDNPHFTEEDMEILFGQYLEKSNEGLNNTSKNENNEIIPNELIPFIRYLSTNEEEDSFSLIVERNELYLSSDIDDYFDDFEFGGTQITNNEPLIINATEKKEKISKNNRKKKIKKHKSISNENNEGGMVLRSGKRKSSVDEIDDQLIKLFKKLSIKDNVDIEIPPQAYVTLASGLIKKLKTGSISKLANQVSHSKKKKQVKKRKTTLEKTEEKKLKKKIKQEELLAKNANTISFRSTATTTLYSFGRDCIPTFPGSEIQPPRKKILCAVCGKPKAYTCTFTGVPICSLKCYRENLQSQAKEIVVQVAPDNYINSVYLERDTTRNLYLNIVMQPKTAQNTLPVEEEQMPD